MAEGASAGFGATAQYCERGDLFVLTGLAGTEPASGELPRGAEEQFRQAFRNVALAGEHYGFSKEEIGRVIVFTPAAAYDPLVEAAWLECFPDPDARPARRTTYALVQEPRVVELEVSGARGDRVAIEVAGLSSGAAVPLGARVGRHVFSSTIDGRRPGGGRPEREVALAQAFENLTAFIEAAGGSLSDLANVWFFLGLWDLSGLYARTWSEVFTDEHSRPSRKSIYYPAADIELQCEGVLGGSRRNLEVPGIGHQDPIPLGSITGGVMTTSGIGCKDPNTGVQPHTVSEQVQNCLANLLRLVDLAGMRPEDLYQVTTLVEHRSYAPMARHVWESLFPAGTDAPAFQTVEIGLANRQEYVQILARAVER